MKKAYTQALTRFRDRAAAFLAGQSALWKGILAFLLGFCFANAALFGSVAPFGPSCVAAAPRKYLTFSLAGAVLGYALSSQSVGNLKYIAAMLLLFAFRKLVREGKTVQSRAIAAAGSAALAVLLPGGILAVYVGLTPYLAVLTLAESCLAGTMAFFLLRTAESVRIRRSVVLLRPAETASLLLCFSVLVIGLGEMPVVGFQAGRCAAALLILTASFLCREGGGAILGLCAGMALALRDTSLLCYTVGWGLGGLAGGLFASAGRLGTAVSLLAASAFAALFSSDGTPRLSIFYEAIPACLLFMCIPVKLLDRLKPYLSGMGSDPEGLDGAAVFRLRYAGESLRQIGEAVSTVSRRLPVPEDDPAAAADETVQEVCTGCERNAVCWGGEYDRMQEAFLTLYKRLGADPPPALADYPEPLLHDCRHPKVVAAALAQRQQAMQRQQGVRRRLQSVQSVVAEQFGGLSGLLEELANRFESVSAYDARATAALTEYLEKQGAGPASTMVCEDMGGRRRAEICLGLSAARRVPLAALADTVSRVCEAEMELCDLSETGSHQRLLFLQHAVYRLDIGVRQIAKDGKLCGDSYDHFTGEDGAAYLLLSDGMGTGGRAALDSAMTCSLLGRLISAGFPFDPALQLVNSAMLVKSSDESLATLDLARVCLFSGETELLKCGAAPTFIRRNGHVGAIAAASLPIGILNGVSSERRSVTLQGGDLLVMVSDGAAGEDASWLKKLLELWHGTAAELAEVIAEQAFERRKDGHTDDITVIAAALKRN